VQEHMHDARRNSFFEKIHSFVEFNPRPQYLSKLEVNSYTFWHLKLPSQSHNQVKEFYINIAEFNTKRLEIARVC
jgi:hypothetical protein